MYTVWRSRRARFLWIRGRVVYRPDATPRPGGEHVEHHFGIASIRARAAAAHSDLAISGPPTVGTPSKLVAVTIALREGLVTGP